LEEVEELREMQQHVAVVEENEERENEY